MKKSTNIQKNIGRVLNGINTHNKAQGRGVKPARYNKADALKRRKVNKMTNAITTKIYENKALQKATDKIRKLETGIQANLYETAAIIAYVDGAKLYTDDGFKNVHEWTKQAFNIEKSTSYAMLKIGRDYTRVLTDDKGKIKGYRSNVTDNDEADFSVTQIVKMLPVSRETLPEAIEAENITPADTVREVETKIKHFMHKDEAEKEDAPEVDETEANEAENVSDEIEDGITFSRDFVMNIFKELSKVNTKTAKDITEALAEILNI